MTPSAGLKVKCRHVGNPATSTFDAMTARSAGQDPGRVRAALLRSDLSRRRHAGGDHAQSSRVSPKSSSSAWWRSSRPRRRSFIVPNIDVVHNRVSVEIMRGCTRGCRFCQAGMITRPVRERSVDEIVEAAEEAVRSHRGRGAGTAVAVLLRLHRHPRAGHQRSANASAGGI